MQERNIIITYEAIYDIVEAEEWIFYRFGSDRAKRYRKEIYTELKKLSTDASIYAGSGFKYRGYTIYKKPFSPAIMFWIIKENEVHVLRVPREEYDWKTFFETHKDYDYSYPTSNVLKK